MKNNAYTIILMSTRASSIFQFKISKHLLYVVTILFILGSIFTGYVSYGYYQIQSNRQVLLNHIKNIRLQKLKIEHIVYDLDNQHRNIIGLQNFNKQLKFIINQYNAIEESEIFYKINAKKTNGSNSSFTDQNRIQDKIDSLDSDVEQLTINFLLIESDLYENQDKLARIPSITPIKSGYRTSPFGMRRDPFTGTRRMHRGLDWAYHLYTPIYAPANGIVKQAIYSSSYGNLLTLDHGYGIVTRYAHLEKIEVAVGDTIKRNQLIARMGNTGTRSTATHLHYEVIVNSKHVDPQLYLLDRDDHF